MLERGLPSLGLHAFNRRRSESAEGNTKAPMMYRIQGYQNVFYRITIYDTYVSYMVMRWTGQGATALVQVLDRTGRDCPSPSLHSCRASTADCEGFSSSFSSSKLLLKPRMFH
ncbi:hypothetical protein PoB_005033500 [Plakobranchus ocellatus]|uniref:Uncharacterized protein n=1 Tax=Plakobranchus ocellatus TaxID=259542 RepID=A0AAV4BTQ6_9GAST|nr:hypothetical protein PoB_005033500 [Plakobranchus ocellatus]